MLITPEKLYKQRRNFLKLGAGALISSSVLASKLSALNFTSDTNPNKLEISDEELATNYVNFYEFSTDKRKAVSLAQNFNTQNWKIDISGEIEKPYQWRNRKTFNFKHGRYFKIPARRKNLSFSLC